MKASQANISDTKDYTVKYQTVTLLLVKRVCSF